MPRKKTIEDYKKELYAERRKTTQLTETVNRIKGEIDAYRNNVTFLKKYAEKAGTKKNEWKAKFLRLDDEHNKIKEELRCLKQVKKK